MLPYEDDLKQALDVLKKGGVILCPTDTVWGLSCDATNPDAVAKVYQIKQRPDSKALITLTDNAALIERVADMPLVGYDLIDMAVRPLTIIYDNAKNLAPNLVAEDGSIAIRVTKEAFSAELCKRFRRPIVSTSANISGQPAAHFFAEISDDIKSQVDYIVKFRQNDTQPKEPSQIIKLGVDGQVKIIRK